MQSIRRRANAVAASCLFLATFYFCLAIPNAPAEELKLQGKQIAMIIGISGYDTSELNVPKSAFEAQGATVHVVSNEAGEAVSGAGIRTNVEIIIDSIAVEDYDAIIFVGGSGAGYFYDSAKAHEIAKQALNQDRILASICAGSTILAKAGVLRGKQATGFYKEPIVEHGGLYSSEYVVRDGNLITAIGPNVTKEFAEAITNALQEK